MKKHILLLSLLLTVFGAIAQQSSPYDNPMAIREGQAVLDGQNNLRTFYGYTGNDTAWSASFANIGEEQTVLINYIKTTTKDCVITFPSGSVVKQPASTPGVTVSGTRFTLSSSDKGTFQFMVRKSGGDYTVQISRSVQ